VDVVKTKAKQGFFSRSYKLILAVTVGVLALMVYAKQSSDSVNVNRADILIGKVKQGNLEVVIEGFGQLKSDKQSLLTALTKGTVKEIVLKPGAKVTSGSVIVRLENPELVQKVQSDTQELALKQANLRQLKLNQKRESLNESVTISQLVARYQTAKLKREAEQTLVESGIVSQLTFKESVLNEKQLKQQMDILNERREQLTQVHYEAINIELEKIKQYEGRLAISVERLARLEVRAGFDGVLQRLSIELGQSLNPGQEIALIGSLTDLIALIRVPQSQAQQVQVGQKAIIDTRQDKIEGRVVRIDPVVDNNTVNIEIALPANLPLSARPQLSVDGTIIAKTLSDVHYIERPANIRPNSQSRLFLLDGNSENAQLTTLKFGHQAGRFIEIVSGAQPNDQFVVSDMSALARTASTLNINL
jgi:HlyD family secretion protein